MPMRFIALLISLAAFSVPGFLAAQVVSTEGIANDVDKHRRGPVVSAGVVYEGSLVKILADSYIPNKEFEKYPTRFDFYINRRLFSSQIRSPELPGPIGVVIGPEVAAVPFNYSIIATLLHPNRSFTTVMNGAAAGGDLIATLDCTLTTNATDDDLSTEFTASDVVTTQPSTNTVGLDFQANSSEDETATLNTVLTVNDQSASGSATIVTTDGTQTVEMTGTVTRTDSKLSAISIASADQTTTLECVK